ncbi:MAG: PLP-dependent aminotransferase family protein [Polyangiaceae bacterium]|nr:PLP-dependent aminotransferase family protein [Polyangiaceae bacterium]
MSIHLAKSAARYAPSAVREILKVAEQPDILSFAGGLPAPELFPVKEIAEAHERVLAREGGAALQYSTTEGFGPLREWIAARLSSLGIGCNAERVLITNGSQQGIDLAARVLLDPGDRVAVENPSYLAALQVFAAQNVRFAIVGSDDEGMRTDELEQIHAREKIRLVYLVPNFQNPRGTTLSLSRRKTLVEFAQRHNIPVLEDDPYGALRFEGSDTPSLAALDDRGVVIHLGTFSKTLAPGLRIGWVTAPAEILRGMTVAKQAADLHTATLAQRATAALLETFDYDGHLNVIRGVYGERRRTMLSALSRHMPKGTRWTRPDGGMFTWVELPHGLSASELFSAALAEHVAFVPGSSFYSENPRHDTMRLNFSNRSPEWIEEGIMRLGRVTARALAKHMGTQQSATA